MAGIILIGGGGHCVSCIEAIESAAGWEISGILDGPSRIGESVLGYLIVGTDCDMGQLAATYRYALITVGQIDTAQNRARLFAAATDAGFDFPVVLASTAHASKHARIGNGTILLHRATVNAQAIVGRNCIINTAALIEHDVNIGDHCHISTGAIVNGGCKVGDGCFIGSGAVLRQGVSVAAGAVIGAGAVVASDIDDAGTWIGCPARRMR